MKKILIVCSIGLILTACGKSNIPRTQKRQKTPSHMVVSQAEKIDANYHQKETHRVLDENRKNKDKNLKYAAKQRQKQIDAANKANATTSKVKKVKNTTFNFY